MAISSIKNKEKENSNNSQFVFDAKDICEFFGVTRATLSNWVKKGAPKEEYGKYDLRELVKWRYSSGLSPEMRKIQAEADLKEILTVKSDDVTGRVKTYEAIVKGEPIPQPGIPESFRVMLKELQSLGLDVVVQDKDGNEIDMRQNFDDEETGFDMRDVAGTENVVQESELLNDYNIKDADAGFDDPSVLDDNNSAAAEPASDEVSFDE